MKKPAARSSRLARSQTGFSAADSATHLTKVQLLLTGGHQYTLYLPSDSALLYDLFSVVVERAQGGRSEGLLQIPIQSDQALLSIAAIDLIGLVTEPPLIVEANASAEPSPSSPPTETILPAQYIQIDNFLPAADYQQLLDYVLNSQSEFTSTGALTNSEYYPEHRNSQVIFYPQYTQPVTERVRRLAPELMEKFDIPAFLIDKIEVQLTAHNDGEYFRFHNDNGSDMTASRQITYVYYFYREPKGFSGGELLIYDTRVEGERHFKTEQSQKVEPLNNSIVFFPSHYMHEVLPVRCPSQAFADSRFTVNGWVHR